MLGLSGSFARYFQRFSLLLAVPWDPGANFFWCFPVHARPLDAGQCFGISALVPLTFQRVQFTCLVLGLVWFCHLPAALGSALGCRISLLHNPFTFLSLASCLCWPVFSLGRGVGLLCVSPTPDPDLLPVPPAGRAQADRRAGPAHWWLQMVCGFLFYRSLAANHSWQLLLALL